MRAQKGITLVALIITIIVLLILAVVAIAAVTDSGVVEKTHQAVKDSNLAAQNEWATLQEYNDKIDTLRASN